MKIGGADAGMDAGAFGVFEGLGGHFDVFFHGAAQTADGGIFNDLGDLLHGMKVSGAGDGEAGLDDIHAQGFQLQGQFDLFLRIELTARHLFSVAEGGVKNEDLLVRTW